MFLQNKFFYKFLVSKKSDFISHAISRLHNTYSTKYIINKIKPSNIISFFLPYLDSTKILLKKKNTVDILIISNLVSRDSLKKDLYFGDLKKILDKNGIKTIKVFRNFTNKSSTELSKLTNNSDIVFSKSTEYSTELKFLYLTLKEMFLFIFFRKYSSIKKYIDLKDFLSIISNLRLINQIEELIKIFKPKIIIFTYEGHAWERLLVNLCKTKYKWITSVGYQFSPIKDNQIGFFKKLKNVYNPDYLATSGQKTFDQISKSIDFTRVFKLGSANFIKNKNKNKNKKTNDLLVALDSEPNELFRMLDFCINFARKNNKLNIILRLHPIYKNKPEITRDILLKIEKITNLQISKKNLKVDLQKTKYLLFTDTAICITCLSYNVVPIFFYNKFSNNIFDNNFPKKYVIKNIDDLKYILNDRNVNKLSPYFKNYRDKYFEEFNINPLKKIMKLKI